MAGYTGLPFPPVTATASPWLQRPVSTNPSASLPSAWRKRQASDTDISPASQKQPQRGRSSSSRLHADNSPPHTNVYNHPAALAYAATHPRRTIPKFGPYLLLQTLREGEKLGLHCTWGEEVTIKLIKRGTDGSISPKVEREINVLRTLKHPNIVHLYDVIETDKYIGIINEYISHKELIDHILAHHYLREREAARLFAQLISGVWYIHQKKVVHRNLKLENVLIDQHKNIIITDFSFANRFDHRADDLMQTSCGSPCYAAPEVVISEGLYVGSAVDVWSCGVVLYAMLSGYLPFGDNPASPDGDNVTLLYQYIVNTPLSFPDYISETARDLLSVMLVPDPSKRASLEYIMQHPWLAAYHAPPTDSSCGLPTAFGFTAEELEKTVMDPNHQKRLAHQDQMKAAPTAGAQPEGANRTKRHRRDDNSDGNISISIPSQARNQYIKRVAFYETPIDHSSGHTSTPLVSATGQSPESSHRVGVDDSLVPPPGAFKPAAEDPPEGARCLVEDEDESSCPSNGEHGMEKEQEKEPQEKNRKRIVRFSSRGHLKQNSNSQAQTPPAVGAEHKRGSQNSDEPHAIPATPMKKGGKHRSSSASRPHPGPVETPSITLTSPDTPIKFPAYASETESEKGMTDHSSSWFRGSGSKRQRGMSSIDRLAKIFNSTDDSLSAELISPLSTTRNNKSASLLSLLTAGSASDKDGSSATVAAGKVRRNSPSVVVELFKSTIKGRSKGRAAPTAISSTSDNVKEKRVLPDTSVPYVEKTLGPNTSAPDVNDIQGPDFSTTKDANKNQESNTFLQPRNLDLSGTLQVDGRPDTFLAWMQNLVTAGSFQELADLIQSVSTSCTTPRI
ncbi:hypothetical protein GYMLUDRAFT_56547 [Collybiopsis luxurians FD-317 M1]|nr:hypothetical protein GYMLUDRAFT_56547 [Collybiopsis luxurians FD-317 M1]